jgi:Protein of unknown function (DUF1592)/Protein of unknown function (DUF1588)/Protein of unknown function (DUF1585)/Protein of unknown function (DUF1587)/Protein of unknown function (DUF1595)
MRSRTWLAGVAVVGIAAAATVVALRLQKAHEQEHWALFRGYCTDCHNKDDLAGNISFQGVTPESVAEHPEIFEAAVRKLRGHLMPPPGNPQPKPADADALIAALETSIDVNAKAHPRVGYVSAQRLNRTEYANAVKDLLDVDIDPADYLPPEIEVKGFTNIAAALSVSPSFIEQYVDAASAVAHLAVGEPKPKVATAFFPTPGADQEGYVAGMPLGTRGGMKAMHTFPADGEYRLTITNLGAGLYPRSLETRHTLVVLIDRHEQWRGAIGGEEDLALMDRGGAPAREQIMKRFANIPLQLTAGTHGISVTFIERSRAASDELVSTFVPQQTFSSTGAPRVPGIVGGINLIGPYNSPGLSPTTSRKKLFVCEPEVPDRERACAEQITSHLARLAFRRPASQADLNRLMPFYEEGRKGPGGFDEGIELMVTAVLASPDFLYRVVSPRGGSANGAYALDDTELASRLSFFLWGQGPDGALLDVAAAGKLSQQSVLDAQIERMLKDPRAAVLVDEFALRWLHVQDLDAIQPDKLLFPEFTDALRRDFAEEIRLFLASVLLDDKDVRTLLTASYTFVNERLARHYGVADIVGPQFRRVTLADPRRFGLLGKGAVLLRTSYGDRTSPVLRGQWVLDKLMGTPPTPPPPGVDTNLATPPGERPKTVRARLEQHRTSSVCKACHGVIDPYGLALENFTATGRWRDDDRDAGAPIDASTELAGGKKVMGPVELTHALLERRDQFVQAFTQKLMMYALGRELDYYDMPEVRAIVRSAAAKDYRFSALVAGIVRSDAFRMQATVTEDGGSVQAAAGSAHSARAGE